MNAPDIARALGAARRSGRWWHSICPAHGSRSGRSLSLALRDHPRGLAMHCHAGCSRDEIIAALRARGLIVDGPDSRPAPPSPAHSSGRDDVDVARRIALAHRIWDAARDPHGSPVMAYLAARHISIPLPRSLRYAPVLRRPDGTVGQAMVGRIDGPDGTMLGISRTWIERGADGRWRRRERAMLGQAAGGAVRLAPAAEVLLIGEGLETVAAGMTATGLLGWAALSTSGLVGLVLPPIVREVVILADNDASGAGERAAHNAAARWLAEGRCVRIALPPEPGTDFADMLRADAEAGRVAA
jgi:putative DNA primase/helicase